MRKLVTTVIVAGALATAGLATTAIAATVAGGANSATCNSTSYDGKTLQVTCTVPQATKTVTATVTKTKTVTVTASPTGSVTTSPTPTPTPTTSSASPTTTAPASPTPTDTPPVTTGFPDSTNTGPVAGTALTPYTGSCNVPGGTVIDSKTITCSGSALVILGPNVKITNSHITGRVSSDHSNTNQANSSVTITDSYIDGGQQEEFPAVSYDSVTLLRDEIVGGQHSVQCNSNCSVTDSYLHAQFIGPNSAGHVNAFISNGGSGFTLNHDTLWCSVNQTKNDGGCTADASLFGDFGPISNATFTNNYFHSTHGSYCVYGGYEPSKQFPTPTNVKITNNIFQRGTDVGQHGFTCGFYGPDTSLGANDTFTGNKYDDGTAIND